MQVIDDPYHGAAQEGDTNNIPLNAQQLCSLYLIIEGLGLAKRVLAPRVQHVDRGHMDWEIVF